MKIYEIPDSNLKITLYKKAEENDYGDLLRKYNNLKTALDESQEVVISYKEENKQLKILCDKYEEEHNTTFIEWKKDIKANKKAIEYINTHSEMTDFQIYGIENTLAFRGSLEKLLNILQGSDKE